MMPRSSGIKKTDCKSNLLNVYKNFNISASFNKINKSSLSSNSNLKICYTNIRSVLNKGDILENYLYMKDIDLFFLTETWLTPKVNDAIICPSNYNIVRSDRISRGGGVAVLYKNSLKVFKVKKDLNLFNSIGFEYLKYIILKDIKLFYLFLICKVYQH